MVELNKAKNDTTMYFRRLAKLGEYGNSDLIDWIDQWLSWMVFGDPPVHKGARIDICQLLRSDLAVYSSVRLHQ
jgi:hypothetical protein